MMKKKQKTSGEIICEFFKLEPQTIYQDYSCSCLSTAIIFFGRLYIGESHFCFNSYMFGVSKRFAIRIDAIKKMEQVKNTITGNYTNSRNEERTFTFGNFVNVGNVFKLMYGLWKGEQIEPRILNEDEQVKSEQEISMDKSQLEISFFNPQQSADNQQTIAEITFPCSVQQYYDYFLKDKSTLYGAQQHYEKKQAQNIEITEWKRNEELGREVREIRALIKVEKVPMLSRAHLYQIQTLSREETGDLVIEQVTQMSDVPYSSYFTCQETISIRGQDGRCKFKASASVPFNKSSYMKKFIQDRTLKDLKADYELWLHSIQETLENIKNRTSRRQSMNAGGSLNRSIEYEKVQSSTLELSGILDRDFTVSSPTKVSDTNVAKLQRKINVLTGLVLLILFISIFNLMQIHAMSGNSEPQVLHQQHEH